MGCCQSRFGNAHFWDSYLIATWGLIVALIPFVATPILRPTQTALEIVIGLFLMTTVWRILRNFEQPAEFMMALGISIGVLLLYSRTETRDVGPVLYASGVGSIATIVLWPISMLVSMSQRRKRHFKRPPPMDDIK